MVHLKYILEEGYHVSIKRVQRLMKKANIRSITVKKFRPTQSRETVVECTALRGEVGMIAYLTCQLDFTTRWSSGQGLMPTEAPGQAFNIFIKWKNKKQKT